MILSSIDQYSKAKRAYFDKCIRLVNYKESAVSNQDEGSQRIGTKVTMRSRTQKTVFLLLVYFLPLLGAFENTNETRKDTYLKPVTMYL